MAEVTPGRRVDLRRATVRLRRARESIAGDRGTNTTPDAKLQLATLAAVCLTPAPSRSTNPLTDEEVAALVVQAVGLLHTILVHSPPAELRRMSRHDGLIGALLRGVHAWEPSAPRHAAYSSFVVLNNLLNGGAGDVGAGNGAPGDTALSATLVATMRQVVTAKFNSTARLFGHDSQRLKLNDWQKNVVQFFWQNLLNFAPRFIHGIDDVGVGTLEMAGDELQITECDLIIFSQVLEFIRLGVNGDLTRRNWDWHHCVYNLLNYFLRLLDRPEYIYVFYLMRGIDLFVLWLNLNSSAEGQDADRANLNAVILSVLMKVSSATNLHATMIRSGGVVRALVGFLQSYRHYIFLQAQTSKQKFKIVVTTCGLLHRLVSGPSGDDCMRELEHCGGPAVLATFLGCRQPAWFVVACVLNIVEMKRTERALRNLESSQEVDSIADSLGAVLMLTGAEDREPKAGEEAEQKREKVKDAFLEEVEMLRQKRLERRNSGDSFLGPSPPEESSLDIVSWAVRTRRKKKKRPCRRGKEGEESCSSAAVAPPIRRVRGRPSRKTTSSQAAARCSQSESTLVPESEDTDHETPVIEILDSSEEEEKDEEEDSTSFANGIMNASSPLEVVDDCIRETTEITEETVVRRDVGSRLRQMMEKGTQADRTRGANALDLDEIKRTVQRECLLKQKEVIMATLDRLDRADATNKRPTDVPSEIPKLSLEEDTS